MKDLKYPIGFFHGPEKIEPVHLESWLHELSAAPSRLKAAVLDLSDSQLDTPYREGGWSVRQVVHHVADSHMNAYIRIKLGLTEENPVIRTYEEKEWAELADSKHGEIDVSLVLLESLHKRLILLAATLSESDFNRTFFHPENKTSATLAETFGVYAWHGNHHIAHIESLRERMGW
ncbi:YfiT family bacillithiol transferase [Metabacillus idriensis]|uniref:YfiT family bacillithiol transferase n=1 Tax=Metabacillus idriensis TaxID=324768 RepID=UPI003D2E00BF